MKKLSLILILGVLLSSQIGFYFIMHYSQQKQKLLIKEEILSNVKPADLEIISLNDNQKNIFWEENGKEFMLNGKMYDVVKYKMVKGKKILYCINDVKEKSLIDNYNLITKHNTSDKKEKSVSQNFMPLFVYENTDDNTFIIRLSENVFSSFHEKIPHFFLNKIAPPPKA